VADEEYWKSYSHPKRVAWRERMRAPVKGSRKPAMNRGNCYGVCCGEYREGGQLCTVCHKYGSMLACCGHYTVKVSPRVRVPPVGAKYRWRKFLGRFPRFVYKPELKIEGGVANFDNFNSASKHDTTRAPNSKKKWKRSAR
jgi:hypothetical protein